MIMDRGQEIEFSANAVIDFYTSAACPTREEAKQVFIKELNKLH